MPEQRTIGQQIMDSLPYHIEMQMCTLSSEHCNWMGIRSNPLVSLRQLDSIVRLCFTVIMSTSISSVVLPLRNERERMKNLLWVYLFCICHSALADDWSWTFKWGANYYGLLFEDVNLGVPVRRVIRDDLERVVSSPFLSSAATVTCTVENGAVGFTGYVSVDGVFKGMPDSLGFEQYTEYSGTNFLHVSSELSEKYLEKIALTNACLTQVSSMSNFVHSVTNIFSGTIDTTVRAELAAKFWVASEKRVWNVSYMSEKSDTEIAEIFSYRFLPISILDFETKYLYGTSYLWCNARVAMNTPSPQFEGLPLVSITNTWFFCNWW